MERLQDEITSVIAEDYKNVMDYLASNGTVSCASSPTLLPGLKNINGKIVYEKTPDNIIEFIHETNECSSKE